MTYYAPPITPEQLYEQDKKAKKHDQDEQYHTKRIRKSIEMGRTRPIPHLRDDSWRGDRFDDQ